ncbi:MAG: FeoB-associated Cys-rich membrane protein [Hominilimicola sp.]
MLDFIIKNLSSIIICAVLLAVVVLIILSMRKNKKQGKSSCGCGCSNCAMSQNCHKT